MVEIDPILFDDEAAIEWSNAVSIPSGYAKELAAHFKRVAVSNRTLEEWARWGQAEERALHSHPQYEAKKAKVAKWLGLGQSTPFGKALRKSRFQHSADVWHTIAEHSPWDSGSDRT